MVYVSHYFAGENVVQLSFPRSQSQEVQNLSAKLGLSGLALKPAFFPLKHWSLHHQGWAMSLGLSQAVLPSCHLAFCNEDRKTHISALSTLSYSISVRDTASASSSSCTDSSNLTQTQEDSPIAIHMCAALPIHLCDCLVPLQQIVQHYIDLSTPRVFQCLRPDSPLSGCRRLSPVMTCSTLEVQTGLQTQALSFDGMVLTHAPYSHSKLQLIKCDIWGLASKTVIRTSVFLK